MLSLFVLVVLLLLIIVLFLLLIVVLIVVLVVIVVIIVLVVHLYQLLSRVSMCMFKKNIQLFLISTFCTKSRIQYLLSHSETFGSYLQKLIFGYEFKALFKT